MFQRDSESNKIIGGETYEIRKSPRNLFFAETQPPITQNDSITYTARSIGEPALYNWYDPDGNLISFGTDLVLDSDVYGTYKLEIVANTDGYKDYEEIQIPNPLSIESISPNPAVNNVTITYKAGSGNFPFLMITNLSSTISNNYILNQSKEKIKLDVSTYATGVYIVSLVCNGQIVDSKNLIKQ